MVQLDVENGKDRFNRILVRMILIGWFTLQLAIIAFVIAETIRIA